MCRLTALVLLVAAGVTPALATAPAVLNARTLMAQGDLPGALTRIERYLASSPQDAEGRFTHGLVLARMERTDDAIKVFADLARDYPSQPEPYNNLAVLYAQKGDYEKARDELQAALATHPAYATASENLGDVYSALAGAAYNRALQLDQGNQTVRNKLSLITQLDAGRTGGGQLAAGEPAPTEAVAVPPPVQVAAATPAPAPLPASAAPPPRSIETVPPPQVAAPTPRPVPARPAPPALAAAPAAADSHAEIEAMLREWARAWSAKKVDLYLSYYAVNFEPEGGVSRRQWETQRRERVGKPGRIAVHVLDPEIQRIDAHHVRVRFRQDYRSETFSGQVTKVLELSDFGGPWKILREAVR